MQVILEHGATGKRKITIDGKCVLEKKQSNSASRHELLLQVQRTRHDNDAQFTSCFNFFAGLGS